MVGPYYEHSSGLGTGTHDFVFQELPGIGVECCWVLCLEASFRFVLGLQIWCALKHAVCRRPSSLGFHYVKCVRNFRLRERHFQRGFAVSAAPLEANGLQCLSASVQYQACVDVSCFVTLWLKKAQRPYIIRSLSPKAFKYESLEP